MYTHYHVDAGFACGQMTFNKHCRLVSAMSAPIFRKWHGVSIHTLRQLHPNWVFTHIEGD